MATPTGPMTTLQAVNEILTALPGMASSEVASLDTGGTSIHADAERYLDRAIRNTQVRGFPMVNIIEDESLTPAATIRFTPAVLTGHAYTHATFRITEATAFASYTWRRKDRYHIVSGTDVTADQWVEVRSKVDSDIIRLFAAPAGTNGNETDWVTDGIGYQYGVEVDANTLWVEAIKKFEQFSVSGNLLYAVHRNDYDMGSATPIWVRRCIQLGFTELPPDIQRIIVEAARGEFVSFLNGDTERYERLRMLKTEAEAGQRVLSVPTNTRDAKGQPPILGSGPSTGSNRQQ